ncbi:MAG: T9SS type A sorting domain-containing protein [Candidatus Eisenbacteria bacterium]
MSAAHRVGGHRGQGGDVSWEVAADPSADVAEITGWFGEAESTYRQVTGFEQVGETWVASFADELSLRGIEYYLDYQVRGESALRSYGSAGAPRRIGFVETLPVPVPAAYQLRLLAAPGAALEPNVYARLVAALGPPSVTSWILATWNPSDAAFGPREAYVYASPETPEAWLPGRAYWFGIGEGDLEWDFRGSTRFPEPRSEVGGPSVYEIPLSPGWNLVGNPAAYRVSLDPSVLLVREGENVQTWASRFGAESELIWIYDPARDAESPYQLAPSVLATWDGCWIENPTGQPLVLGIPAIEAAGPVAAARSFGAEARSAAEPRFEVVLSVRSGGERRELAVGVVGSEDAPRIRRTVPPYPGQRLHAGIDGAENVGGARRVDWRAEDDAAEGFTVAIDAAEPVVLTWTLGGSEAVGADWNATIEDRAAHRVWSLHSLRSLDLPSGRHEFVLKLERSPGGEPVGNELRLSVDPNPITDDTVISFRLPDESAANLSVFDVTGHRVWAMPGRTFEAGEHALMWNGERDGVRLPSGTYFIRLEVKSRGGVSAETRKFVLLR